MDYFKILNLLKEPFSNSPDPEFFFKSKQHFGCLQKIELSIRLKRGMNVVIGDVGTGKTTLCRQLIRIFSEDPEVECHLILDPSFSTPSQFLLTISKMLNRKSNVDDQDERELKGGIKNTLFQKGVDGGKTIVLIIDEGQKIPQFCLEILRELLNYETNEHKLLQIVIFAQEEFKQTIENQLNFADRINLLYHLRPLGFQDTRQMIQFRINQSSSSARPLPLFSYPALWAVYRASKGYPRKIINLCHQSLLAMIIQNRSQATLGLVRSCVRRAIYSASTSRLSIARIFILLMLIGVVTGGFMVPWQSLDAILLLVRGNDNTEPVRYAIHTDQGDTIIPSAGPESIKNIPVIVKMAETDADTAPAMTGIEDSKEEAATHYLSSHEPQSLTGSPYSQQSIIPTVPPRIMGQIPLQKNDTLGKLIRIIYGTYHSGMLTQVLVANPHIENPNDVQSGEIVSFPTIPVALADTDTTRWWIRLMETDDLADALAWQQSNQSHFPSAICVSSWSADNGFSFSWLLREHYYNKVSAERKIQSLPAPEGVLPSLVSRWNRHHVFFSDPYRGYVR
ncbi:MAG: AAA family ATPase [Desulfobacteraceae bacterium]|nr:AAA family ATPase [Desulfobacteraceae bacterium]